MSVDNKQPKNLSPRAKSLLKEIQQQEQSAEKMAVREGGVKKQFMAQWRRLLSRFSPKKVPQKADNSTVLPEIDSAQGASVAKKSRETKPTLSVFNNNTLRPAIEKLKTFIDPSRQKKQFHSTTYISLSKSSRQPIWASLMIVVIIIFVLLAYNLFQIYSTKQHIDHVRDNVIPDLVSKTNNIKGIISNNQKLEQALSAEINDSLQRFLSLTEVKALLGPIAETFEKKNLAVIDQKVAFNDIPNMVKVLKPTIAEPAADQTFFIAEEEAKKAQELAARLEKLKAEKRGAGQQTAAASNETKLSKEAVAVLNEKIEKLRKSIPGEIKFMTVTLNLRGEYLDYLRARDMLINYLPNLSIPMEEIVMNDTNGAIEYRVVYELPYIISQIKSVGKSTTQEKNNRKLPW